jgi:hypothetical protein
LVAARRAAAVAVAGFALAPIVAREIGVTIDLGGILGPSGQEKLFQVKIRFWGCAHG